jgi:predicted dehydrogenase
MIRAGVVGYGLAGKVFHAPMISAVDGLELAAVVERSSRNAELAYPGVTTYTSLEAMLDDESIELVVIATPNLLHAPQAEAALAAGRHVVVDKPVGNNSTQIATLIAKANEQNRLLIPFHNRRWDSDFRTLQKLLLEQSLGRVVYLESTFDRWRPTPRRNIWREDGSDGGGLLLDLGTHVADQALVLFGLPEGVTADVRTERDNGVTMDSFTIRLRYLGQAVTLSANCLASLPRPRYVVRGTTGNFVKWGLDPQEARLKETGRVVENEELGWGEEPPSAWGTLATDVGGTIESRPLKPIPGDYRLYYAGVRDAILGKAAPPVLAVDAWRTTRLLEWAQESSDKRCEVVCNWSESPSGI